MKNIVSLSFSGRKDGNCAGIRAEIEDFYNQTNVRSFSIQNIKSCGSCQYQCLKAGETCPELSAEYKDLMDCICSSELVYFIVPNYCGFPCSAYFTFNERSVGYFNMSRSRLEQYLSVKKRFIVVSNTESAAFESAMQQQTAEVPEILYLKTSKYGKRSIAGDLMDSTDARDDLKRFLKSYTC